MTQAQRSIPMLPFSGEEAMVRELELLSAPPKFDIEASLACNLACSMCPRDQIFRPIKVMSKEILALLPQWLPQGPADIFFCGMGEPTLNKHLCDIIPMMVGPQRSIGITTNAATLDANLAQSLIDTGLDFIQISFNSLKKDVYESIMMGGTLEIVLANLDHLAQIKPPNLKVELAFTEQDENWGELPQIKAYTQERGFSLQHNLLHTRGGNHQHQWRTDTRSDINVCGIFPRRHFISSTGHILACCHDLAGSTQLGHVSEVSFQQLLENKRRRILNNQWFDICPPCDDITRMTDMNLEQI